MGDPVGTRPLSRSNCWLLSQHAESRTDRTDIIGGCRFVEISVICQCFVSRLLHTSPKGVWHLVSSNLHFPANPTALCPPKRWKQSVENQTTPSTLYSGVATACLMDFLDGLKHQTDNFPLLLWLQNRLLNVRNPHPERSQQWLGG